MRTKILALFTILLAHHNAFAICSSHGVVSGSSLKNGTIESISSGAPVFLSGVCDPSITVQFTSAKTDSDPNATCLFSPIQTFSTTTATDCLLNQQTILKILNTAKYLNKSFEAVISSGQIRYSASQITVGDR